jgi:hypothetical protein
LPPLALPGRACLLFPLQTSIYNCRLGV